MPANTTFVSCSPEVGDVLGPDVMKSTKVIRRAAMGGWDPAHLLDPAFACVAWATSGSLCSVYLSLGRPWTALHKLVPNII